MFAFLVTVAFLRVAVVIGGLSYAPQRGLQQSFAHCPDLQVLARVDASGARVGRAGRAISSMAMFREEQLHCNRAARRAVLLAYGPNYRLFLRKMEQCSSSLCT